MAVICNAYTTPQPDVATKAVWSQLDGAHSLVPVTTPTRPVYGEQCPRFAVPNSLNPPTP